MMAETNARRLRRKNAKALWLPIKLSECEAAAQAAAKAKAERHVPGAGVLSLGAGQADLVGRRLRLQRQIQLQR